MEFFSFCFSTCDWRIFQAATSADESKRAISVSVVTQGVGLYYSQLIIDFPVWLISDIIDPHYSEIKQLSDSPVGLLG